MATGTAPSAWWNEDAEALATCLELLNDQAERMRKEARRRG